MSYLEIFSLVTGIIYIFLQIRQKNIMWIVDILSCVAAAIVFVQGRLWANAGLNIYYSLMAVWGIVLWRRDSQKVSDGELHLRKISPKVWCLSAALFAVAGAALIWVLEQTQDANPVMDGIIGVLGILGAWWLAKSYLENWLVWLLADILGTVLCITQGLYWMAALYALYVAASVWGYVNWKKKGVYVQ